MTDRNVMADVITRKISSRSKVIYELLRIRKVELRTASQRILYLFLDQLEQQFPINDQSSAIELRYPSQFAEQLNVHVNHLNRTLKETLNKTTTEIISMRILYEAERLLGETNWDIAGISYALGFSEPTHFNNFFKKRTQVSPTKFRQRIIRENDR